MSSNNGEVAATSWPQMCVGSPRWTRARPRIRPMVILDTIIRMDQKIRPIITVDPEIRMDLKYVRQLQWIRKLGCTSNT